MILAGDIGGTHTRLALFEPTHPLKCVERASVPSRSAPDLLPLLLSFLEGRTKSISAACFGVPGPVRDGKCRTTNLPWSIDGVALKNELRLPAVTLLNDLEANAWGLRSLAPDDFYLLQAGDPAQTGNGALLSAGTGLGEAGLYWDGAEHHPFASEGGHVDFAPRNAREVELQLFLRQRYGHVSYERIVSGPGLVHLYEFLRATDRIGANAALEEQMQRGDPAVVIAEAGLHDVDSGCGQVLDWFVSLYGAEAGNAALKFLALGGLYIGGGIAPHLLGKFKQGGFLKAFLDKGRFAPLLASIPVRIVLNEDAALRGAAEFAYRKLGRLK